MSVTPDMNLTTDSYEALNKTIVFQTPIQLPAHTARPPWEHRWGPPQGDATARCPSSRPLRRSGRRSRSPLQGWSHATPKRRCRPTTAWPRPAAPVGRRRVGPRPRQPSRATSVRRPHPSSLQSRASGEPVGVKLTRARTRLSRELRPPVQQVEDTTSTTRVQGLIRYPREQTV